MHSGFAHDIFQQLLHYKIWELPSTMVTIRKIFIQLAQGVLCAAMVLLVLAAGGLMALQTEPVRDMAIRFIEEALAENPGGVQDRKLARQHDFPV
ncbi:MAG: hypothetical protein R2875_17720 [Desulfobacterales bacterium]